MAPADVQQWSDDDAQEVSKKSPFLKAHMRNGDLFVLSDWRAGAGNVVSGTGTHYDPARNALAHGSFQVSIDSVAVFETNELEQSSAAAGLTVLAILTVGVAIACIVNPKACFGSCPTFYVAGHARPLAEGFSASIAPILEATDVDALDVGAVAAGPFEIVMKNEAYETHVVRHTDVLAFPHREGERVFAGLDGVFHRVTHLQAPTSARGDEGDCAESLRATDGIERTSPADSTDLATKETVELVFDDARAGARGLVIASRQSLLSTYLLYQAYAYMGEDAGHWMAEIERGKLISAGDALIERFGGIAVSIEHEPGAWTDVGEVLEFGPIAVDHHLLTFDAPATWTGRARLTMAKGAWRIDSVQLATVGAPEAPMRVSPSRVLKHGEPDDAALVALVDRTQPLATLPGDEYTLVYQLPDAHASYDVFLESRGYYLEWIRDAWKREGNPFLLAQLFFDPAAALVRLAPEYKKVEAGMEHVFWSSRYAKP